MKRGDKAVTVRRFTSDRRTVFLPRIMYVELSLCEELYWRHSSHCGTETWDYEKAVKEAHEIACKETIPYIKGLRPGWNLTANEIRMEP